MTLLYSRENLGNLPHGFDAYYVNVKAMSKIAHIFVAFSGRLNFYIKRLLKC